MASSFACGSMDSCSRCPATSGTQQKYVPPQLRSALATSTSRQKYVPPQQRRTSDASSTSSSCTDSSWLSGSSWRSKATRSSSNSSRSSSPEDNFRVNLNKLWFRTTDDSTPNLACKPIPGEIWKLPASLSPESMLHEQLVKNNNKGIVNSDHPVVVVASRWIDGEEHAFIRVATSGGGKGFRGQSLGYQRDHPLIGKKRDEGHTDMLTLTADSPNILRSTYLTVQPEQTYLVEVRYLERWSCGSCLSKSLDRDSVRRLHNIPNACCRSVPPMTWEEQHKALNLVRG